jgi:uncharacterized protein (DUF608 family)
MAANKADTDAILAFGADNYAAMPKSVLAMIAYSFAQRITQDGDRDQVMAEIAREWDALHASGIVPQKPKRLETMEQEAARLESYPATHRQDGLGASNRARIAELRA